MNKLKGELSAMADREDALLTERDALQREVDYYFENAKFKQ